MSSIFLGIDVGSISVKVALSVDKTLWEHADSLVAANKGYKKTKYQKDNKQIYLIDIERVSGNPRKVTQSIISKIMTDFPNDSITGITLTGAGSKMLASELGLKAITEFKSIAETFKTFYPQVRSIFEIGGENSKYLGIRDGIISDYETNGDCAAGTGSFLDLQAKRLMFNIEEVGDLALNVQKTPVIAGRCSVFAKSDMIHAQQKGYSPAEILRGLCNSISINLKSNLLRGKEIATPVAFIGGVALNKAVTAGVKEIFNLKNEDFLVPEYPEFVLAIGSAVFESHRAVASMSSTAATIQISEENFPKYEQLDMSQVVLLRNEVPNYNMPETSEVIDGFLGIDIGSVSTNLVVVDKEGNVLHEIYVMTAGRPIQVVGEGLRELDTVLGSRVKIRGVGTTGSGRELIGEIIGADVVKDEITAHKTGASYISKKYFNENVDTILEIGGQDSKFISLDNGVVVDFTMNEACSAGTGSFLQEQAEKLGINIKGEFANLALSSKAPINLGERCTVFIEKDLNSYQSKGAAIQDLVGGLAYSVVHNYLNRVVRGRKIGRTIYFQGGTAYNDAVAAAFSKVLNKRIIVPPHNGVMGAVGMALIAKENFERTAKETTFTGYDINAVNYNLKQFTCKGCSNQCDIQEFTVEDRKTYWGDKCSEKFRKSVKTNLQPIIKDLFKEREKALFDSFNKYHRDADPLKKTIGFPRAMYFYDRLPFWSTFFGELGLRMILSDPTNKKISTMGVETVVAEPCYPIKVAHGHVLDLIDKNPDYILVPAMITSECQITCEEEKKKVAHRKNSYFCPWGQTLPYVVLNNVKVRNHADKMLMPKLELREGDSFVIKDLTEYFTNKFFWVNKNDIEKAYYKAKASLEKFRSDLYDLYDEALQSLSETNREGIVIVGRPYNVNDSGINLNLSTKLRDNYGVNVIPLDLIPLQSEEIDDVHDNMFWGYGRKILATLKDISRHNNLHVIYVTNFQCGPDSYIKHFAPVAAGKSYLTLQFDGHGNDAGMLTRCEAYLDSKGVFQQ